MKNNSKNRKLRFIREKNQIRQGKVVIQYEKISNLILFDLSAAEHHINLFIKDCKEKLRREFNLRFDCIEVNTRLMGDDFANDMKTLFIHLKAL